MVLLDTNIVVELLKSNATINHNLRQIGFDQLAINDIIVAELLYGALNKGDQRFIERSIRPIAVLPLVPPIGEQAVNLLKAYTLSHRLGLADALIAATALHYGLPLYTLNHKDFRYVAGLTLYEP